MPTLPAARWMDIVQLRRGPPRPTYSRVHAGGGMGWRLGGAPDTWERLSWVLPIATTVMEAEVAAMLSAVSFMGRASTTGALERSIRPEWSEEWLRA